MSLSFPRPRACGRSAFSLIEMMIAIVILGLGLTMVATMFPVAWDRARRLSEYTTERTVTDGVAVMVESTLRPGGMRDAPSMDSDCKDPSEFRLGTAGLAGDLLFDPAIYHNPKVLAGQLWQAILNVDSSTLPKRASDTRVHALNLENLFADAQTPPETASENPWLLEQIKTPWLMKDYPDANFPRELACGFVESSFLTPRFPVNMRVYPSMEALPELTQPGGPALRDLWFRRIERRRFAWSVLHRLRDYVGPTPDDFNDALNVGSIPVADLAVKAAAGWGSPRVFDMYYITLRRPNPSNRYAMQDPDSAPNPDKLTTKPAVIQALPPDNDVLFPVAWRVQVELPDSLDLRANATGIPTEIRVPPSGATEPMVDMMISMFPEGTRFVDEINGRSYRVVSAGLNADATQAILRLDREITLEDIDLAGLSNGGLPIGPPECPTCQAVTPTNANADPEELLRTVWVFPPPVDRSQSPSETSVVFEGRSPVSSIDVRSVTLAPPPS